MEKLKPGAAVKTLNEPKPTGVYSRFLGAPNSELGWTRWLRVGGWLDSFVLPQSTEIGTPPFNP